MSKEKNVPKTWEAAVTAAKLGKIKIVEDVNHLQDQKLKKAYEKAKTKAGAGAIVMCSAATEGLVCHQTECIDGIITVLYCSQFGCGPRAAFIEC